MRLDKTVSTSMASLRGVKRLKQGLPRGKSYLVSHGARVHWSGLCIYIPEILSVAVHPQHRNSAPEVDDVRPPWPEWEWAALSAVAKTSKTDPDISFATFITVNEKDPIYL